MRLCLVAALVALSAPVALAPSARAQGDPPFVASRPGATEGPIAVPAGYLQVETELASYARSRGDGVKADGYSLAASSLRYGLGDGWDAELILQPWLHARASTQGVAVSDEGPGDVTLRLLKNLSGQDGEGAALAVIGYVSLPAARGDLGAGRAEAGGFLTGSFPLVDGWGAAWTIGAAARHTGGGDYQAEGSLALQVNHALSDAVSGYAEVAATRTEHDTQTAATFDIGAAWVIDPTTQIDAGANFGVTDATDDISVFAGWAHRF